MGPPLVMVALGGMTLALTAAALWRVIDPLMRPGGAAAAGPPESRRNRELDREKQLRLIGEIEAGDDYRSLIERELAIRLKLAPAEVSKPAAAAPATPRAHECGSCQTANDEDAQFCKKCGAKL